jgi:hypothetical protein
MYNDLFFKEKFAVLGKHQRRQKKCPPDGSFVLYRQPDDVPTYVIN